jgi:hypothetical protein
MYTSAAVAKDQAIVGMNGGRYQSLDLRTGKTRWKFDPGGAVDLSSALVDGDTVYMFPGNAQSELFAIDASTGQPRAGFPMAIPDPAPIANDGMLGRGPAMSSPMMAGGLVIVQLRRQHILNNPVRGLPFRVVMREYVVAVDPKLAKVVWQRELASTTAPDVNGVPELNTCPTPAAFAYAGGTAVAVSSSVEGRIAVLDVATGAMHWTATLPERGLASPIFSNGKLLVATSAGVLHAFSSQTNAAPAAPTALATSGDPADGTFALGWAAASDPEGETLSYRVRVVEAGTETTVEGETSPGQTHLPVVVKAHTTYEVTVRSRDPKGALSAWSASHVVAIGAITPPATTLPEETMPAAVPTTLPEETMPAAVPTTLPEETMPAAVPTSTDAEVSPAVEPPATELPPAPAPAQDLSGAAVSDDDAAMAAGCSVGGARRDSSAALAGCLAVALLALTRRARRR